jgi:hypothetical protein
LFFQFDQRPGLLPTVSYTDLQKNGVRCWIALHDLKIDHLDGPDAAIRMRDKVLSILSENSIASGWVKKRSDRGF